MSSECISGSEYASGFENGRVLNKPGLHKVLNMPEYARISMNMPEYARISLNMPKSI